MLNRVSAPAALISTDELKQELGISHSESDTMLDRYMKRATAYLDGPEGILGRAIMSQQWTATLPSFSSRIEIGLGPLIQVDQIRYFDTDDAQQTLDPSPFRVHGGKWNFYLKLKLGETLPSTEIRDDAVTITFTAGYATRDEVPEPIAGAIVMMAGYFYHQPSAGTVERTHPAVIGVDDLIAPFRNYK